MNKKEFIGRLDHFVYYVIPRTIELKQEIINKQKQKAILRFKKRIRREL